MVIEYLRSRKGEDVTQEEILTQLPMARKTAWKIIDGLYKEGTVRVDIVRGPTGHRRMVYSLTEEEHDSTAVDP